jgi:hypothetical protein
MVKPDVQTAIMELIDFLSERDLLGNSFGVDEIITAALTAKTGSDLLITNATGKDIKVTFSDNAGVRKLIFYDSDDAEIGSWDSNGKITAAGGFAGNLTGNVTGDVTGNVTGNINGKCRTTYAHTDTDGAPTNAECVSAFGAAATVGAGFIGIYQDDHASGKAYVCVSNGSTYSVELTAAA